MRKDITTIRITKENRERLKALGYKGETYNAVLERLLDTMEVKQK